MMWRSLTYRLPNSYLTPPHPQRYAISTMPNSRSQDQYEQLTALLDALKETLPGLPGFRTLSLFGSLAEGRADGYSDIDMVVTTDDLTNAKAQLLGTLELIGPVEFCWVINLNPGEWNPTIVFREEGYYHKLDLGLVDASAVNRTIPDEQTVLLCNKHRPAQAKIESSAYAPEHGSVGHFLLGQFLGCSRYLKARRRGKTMTCYRFASAAVDWRLALLYARLTGNPQFRSKLSTVTYLELDRLMPAGDCAALMSDIGYSDMATMDRTLQRAVEGMLKDGEYLAGMVEEDFPDSVFARIKEFLAGELTLLS